MPAYMIVDIDVRDAEQYKKYMAAAPPTIAQHGGKYLVRGGAPAKVEGEWSPSRIVVLEFPDRATAQRWHDSPEYQKARNLRTGAATFRSVLVEGSPPVVP